MNPLTLSHFVSGCMLVASSAFAVSGVYDGSYPLDKLPSLQEAAQMLNNKDNEFRAVPFNYQKTSPYNYSFLGVNGECNSLVYSGSDYLVTYGRVAGNYSDDCLAVHVWNAHDFSYDFSVLLRGGGEGVDVHVDSESKRFVFYLIPEAQGRFILPGGVVAYHLPSGEFCVKSVQGGPDTALNFRISDALASMGTKTFSGIDDFNGLQQAIPMYRIRDIQKVPELVGLNHHFAFEGEEILRRIDFNTLKMRESERVPHASEVSLSSILGLSQEDASVEVLENGSYGYLAITFGQRRCLQDALFKACMEEEPVTGVYVYDPLSKRLLEHPGETLCEVKGSNMGYIPFYYDTGMGYMVHNGIISLRGDIGWCGPVLFNPKTGMESKILFKGMKSEDFSACFSRENKTAYRVESRLDGAETLGSSLSVWEQVPGDSSKSYWIAGGENVCAFVLMDEETKTGRVIQRWSGLWGRNPWAVQASNPVWIADKQWLCLPVQENCWEVYEFKDMTLPAEKKYMIYTGTGSSWALVLPDGRYAGSPGCEKLISAEVDGKRIPMQKLALWRNRPGEVLEFIGGNADDVAALKATTKRWLAKMNLNPESMPPEPTTEEFPQAEVPRTELMNSVGSESFEVRLVASPKRALTTFDVRVNGAAVAQSWSDSLLVPAGRQSSETLTIPLNVGQNNVSLTPVDSGGRVGDSVNFRVVHQGDVKSRLFVVALGVSDYDDDSLDLQFAAKDAGDLSAAFSKYGSGDVKALVLKDKEVTKADVLEKVKTFLSDSSLNDRVVFYLAGHGMLDDKLEYHYAPADFDAERVAETGISMDALVGALQDIPARERLLLLDTCHSGQLGEAGEEKLAAAGVQLPHGVRAVQNRGMKVRKAVPAFASEKQQKRYIEEMFSMGQQYRGVNIVAGAAGAEFALESGDWNNGVFTASVIQTLQSFSTSDANKDGVLSVGEMLTELQSKVQQLTGGAQMPNIVSAENSNMVIARGLNAELMCNDMSAIVRRIEAASDAGEALFLLDQLYCFRKGAEGTSHAFMNWHVTLKELEKWGRHYDGEQQRTLMYAFNLCHPRTVDEIENWPSIPKEVWTAVAAKGVPSDSILPVLNNSCVDNRDNIKSAIIYVSSNE